jgi:hypothetical protein
MSADGEDDPLVLMFIPPLVDVLAALERETRRPLTEAEVLAARDGATCMAMPYSAALKLDQSRPYHDIDAEHVWDEWQERRVCLG